MKHHMTEQSLAGQNKAVEDNAGQYESLPFSNLNDFFNLFFLSCLVLEKM